MKAHVSWLDRDHRVILHTFEPGWSWADFLEASRLSARMMDTVDHLVDIIADGRGVELPDRALTIMPQIAKNSATLNHPNGGRYVLVGLSRVVRTFVEVYMNVFKNHSQKIFFVSTFVEAYEILDLAPENIVESTG